MPLPQQAIEKMIHDPAETQGAFKQFLLLASSLLILMIVIYVGLTFGYQTYLQGEIEKQRAKIESDSKRIPVAEQAQLINFYSQLANLKTLLAAHSEASPLLSLIERTVVPGLYYTKLNFNAGTGEVDLNGVAQSLDAIAGQTAIFQADPNIARVNLANVSQVQGLNQNTWQFSIVLFVQPQLIRPNSSSTLAQ